MTDLDGIAASLRTATARLTRRLRAEAGQAEYSSSQIAVIRRLIEHGPSTTSDLARAESMRPQSMSATVAALEAAGLVRRRPDPADGRAAQVSLSPEGERSILEGRAAKQEWLTGVLAERLTAAEQRTLADAAALIERILEP